MTTELPISNTGKRRLHVGVLMTRHLIAGLLYVSSTRCSYHTDAYQLLVARDPHEPLSLLVSSGSCVPCLVGNQSSNQVQYQSLSYPLNWFLDLDSSHNPCIYPVAFNKHIDSRHGYLNSHRILTVFKDNRGSSH